MVYWEARHGGYVDGTPLHVREGSFEQWRPWFAWRPVRLTRCGRWRWLCTHPRNYPDHFLSNLRKIERAEIARPRAGAFVMIALAGFGQEPRADRHLKAIAKWLEGTGTRQANSLA